MARSAANRCSFSHATVSCYSAADAPRPYLCSPTTLQDPSRDDCALLPAPTPYAGVNSPDLIGQLVEVLAHLPVDVDFPYTCSSGLLGSSDGSITALCGGLVLPQRVNSAPSFTTLPSAAADNPASVCCLAVPQWFLLRPADAHPHDLSGRPLLSIWVIRTNELSSWHVFRGARPQECG